MYCNSLQITNETILAAKKEDRTNTAQAAAATTKIKKINQIENCSHISFMPVSSVHCTCAQTQLISCTTNENDIVFALPSFNLLFYNFFPIDFSQFLSISSSFVLFYRFCFLSFSFYLSVYLYLSVYVKCSN